MTLHNALGVKTLLFNRHSLPLTFWYCCLHYLIQFLVWELRKNSPNLKWLCFMHWRNAKFWPWTSTFFWYRVWLGGTADQLGHFWFQIRQRWLGWEWHNRRWGSPVVPVHEVTKMVEALRWFGCKYSKPEIVDATLDIEWSVMEMEFEKQKQAKQSLITNFFC